MHGIFENKPERRKYAVSICRNSWGHNMDMRSQETNCNKRENCEKVFQVLTKWVGKALAQPCTIFLCFLDWVINTEIQT